MEVSAVASFDTIDTIDQWLRMKDSLVQVLPQKQASTSEYTKYTQLLKSQQTLLHDRGFNLLSFIPVVNFQVGSIMGTRTQWISIAQLGSFPLLRVKATRPEVLGEHPHGTRHF